jgi:transposase
MKSVAKNITISNNNSPNSEQEILLLRKAISQLSSNNKELTIVNDSLLTRVKSKDSELKSKDSELKSKDSELKSKDSQIQLQKQDLKNQEFEISYYKKLIFGRRSEKAKHLTSDEKQLSLFDEIQRHDSKSEEEAEILLSEDVKEILRERARLNALEKEYKENDKDKKKRGRKSFKVSNPNITVERKEIDISDEEKNCHCGACLTKIGEETSETIEYIPASLKIVENVRFKYACKTCEGNIKIAKKVDKVFDRTAVSSSLLSHILVSKFEDHLPFYRQNKIFKRYGIKIEDKLMNNWLFKSAKLFAPLFMLLKDEIRSSKYIAIDETTLTTIDKSKSNQSYMWVYQSKTDGKKLLYYDFCLDRSSKNPQLVLNKNYQGYIQTDGYSGYSFLNNYPQTVRLGCMAHARRKFSDIAKLIKVTAQNKNDIIAHKALNKIDRIYLIEKRIKIEKITDEKTIQDIRQKEAKPLLEELYSYIKKKEQITLSGSPIHKALTYFLNQYQYLQNYLKNPILDIDNNKTENAIRPFALGRKNWMFVGDEQGGTAAGTIYSLIESAKLNKLHTQKYLKYLFDNIKEGMTTNILKKFLPHEVDEDIVNGWV